jgi:hypothetical protein
MNEKEFQTKITRGQHPDLNLERRNAGSGLNPHTGNYMSSGKRGKPDMFGTANYTCRTCGRNCTGLHVEIELKKSGATLCSVSDDQRKVLNELRNRRIRTLVVAPSKTTQHFTPTQVMAALYDAVRRNCPNCQMRDWNGEIITLTGSETVPPPRTRKGRTAKPDEQPYF